MYWPITAKFKIRKQTSKSQSNVNCELPSEELNEGRSSQLYTQLLQLRKESLKTLQACTGFDPRPVRYRCSALPVKLTSQLRADLYRCCLRVMYLAPYWLIPRNTITFHKYFWCSQFCEFHSNSASNDTDYFACFHYHAIRHKNRNYPTKKDKIK